ncbi:tetratricopeptide repeat protein [Aliifodinibius salicampi]|uniref:Tetratricopeptide repeat protein n=1 Tax=Fodinibius salicampi TaxID=1920655 RepID=A0ABT3PU23_9BACT|nr:tetratricopeptide repeat protein [Fodinibius salicampi]MCW9711351.1 tetratricopeptide repeat protein [Fodinibius salicampi]
MINFITRIAGLVLAFGFFIGCSVLQNSSEQQSAESPDILSEQEFEEYLREVEKQISTNPTADLYLRKGNLLIEWAQLQSDPQQRTEFYQQADLALTKSDSLSDTLTNRGLEDEINQLRQVVWSSEHNEGVQYLQDAQSKDQYRQAGEHFTNASAIMPDSSSSYEMATRAFYKASESQRAITLLEEAQSRLHPPPVQLLESLAFLYMETGEPQKAAQIYNRALSQVTFSFNLMHGLANAYIESKEHQKAADILQELVEKQPNTVRYRKLLAKELYQGGEKQIQTIVDNVQENQSLDQNNFVQADSLFNSAEQQYSYLIDNHSEDMDLYFEAAQFYQNSAAYYQKLLPHLNNQMRKEISDTINRYLSTSLPLLEKMAEEEQPPQQIWQQLYQTYSYLGMEEEAMNVKDNL